MADLNLNQYTIDAVATAVLSAMNATPPSVNANVTQIDGIDVVHDGFGCMLTPIAFAFAANTGCTKTSIVLASEIATVNPAPALTHAANSLAGRVVRYTYQGSTSIAIVESNTEIVSGVGTLTLQSPGFLRIPAQGSQVEVLEQTLGNLPTAVAAGPTIDGVSFEKVLAAILATAAGKAAVTDNGDGTYTVVFKRQNGTTTALSVIYNPLTGERATTAIIP